MKLLDRIRFKLGRWAFKGISRGFSEVASTGKQMSDWILSGVSDDADLQMNWPALVSKSRDLFKLNPYMRKFRVDLIANVFGSEGITLQMKIKEETDRVVYADDGREIHPWAEAERAWLEAKQRASDEWVERAKKNGNAYAKVLRKRFYTVTKTGRNGSTRAKAVVKAGQPDVYANNLIERAWQEWQKRENCTVGKRHTYHQTREQRLTMCARDGDVFIRHVRGKAAARNRFGYAIQLISAEWIDHGLNQELENGHQIKMGIEYDAWGAVVAYYVIRRHAGDWRNYYASGFSAYSPERHERVEARDMTHYCAFEDSETGRQAPWIVSVMTKLRHLDKYGEAEVISARAEACKGGHYEPTVPGVLPEDLAEYIEQIGENAERLTQVVEPAMWKILPYGYTAKAHDPKHPNGNYGAYKKEVGREIAVGCGGFYNTMFGDLEGVNFTSSRAGFMDVRELYKLLQRFDIDTAERPIFENFLEAALATGAIPLPLTKLDKFNHPSFQGRRWDSVQPIDDIRADRLAVEGNMNSRTRLLAEAGRDLEEVIEELAMEKILLEEAGLTSEPVAITEPRPNQEETDNEPAKPAKDRNRISV